MARRSLPRATRLANIAAKRPRTAARITAKYNSKQSSKIDSNTFNKMFPQLGKLTSGALSKPNQSFSSTSDESATQVHSNLYGQVLENQNKQNDILNQILRQIKTSNNNFSGPTLLNNNQNNDPTNNNRNGGGNGPSNNNGNNSSALDNLLSILGLSAAGYSAWNLIKKLSKSGPTVAPPTNVPRPASPQATTRPAAPVSAPPRPTAPYQNAAGRWIDPRTGRFTRPPPVVNPTVITAPSLPGEAPPRLAAPPEPPIPAAPRPTAPYQNAAGRWIDPRTGRFTRPPVPPAPAAAPVPVGPTTTAPTRLTTPSTVAESLVRPTGIPTPNVGTSSLPSLSSSSAPTPRIPPTVGTVPPPAATPRLPGPINLVPPPPPPTAGPATPVARQRISTLSESRVPRSTPYRSIRLGQTALRILRSPAVSIGLRVLGIASGVFLVHDIYVSLVELKARTVSISVRNRQTFFTTLNNLIRRLEAYNSLLDQLDNETDPAKIQDLENTIKEENTEISSQYDRVVQMAENLDKEYNEDVTRRLRNGQNISEQQRQAPYLNILANTGAEVQQPPDAIPDTQNKDENDGSGSGEESGGSGGDATPVNKDSISAKQVENIPSAPQQRQNNQGGGTVGTPEAAMAFFISRGWTREQAAGIAGNLRAESSFNPRAHNRGEDARGIAQWRLERIRNFQRWAGRDILDSSFETQLEFVQYELMNTHRRAGERLRNTTTVEDAAAVVDQFYEISAGIHRRERINFARQYLAGDRSQPQTQAQQSQSQMNPVPLSGVALGGIALSQAGTNMVAADQRQARSFHEIMRSIMGISRQQTQTRTASSSTSNAKASGASPNEVPLRNRLESAFSYKKNIK